MKKFALLLATACLMTISIAEEEVKHYSTPLQAVFADNNIPENTELSNVAIIQTLSQVENPTHVMITIIQSDLLDDAVGAIKTDYELEKAEEGWAITGQTESHQCRRSEQKDEFTTQPCL